MFLPFRINFSHFKFFLLVKFVDLQWEAVCSFAATNAGLRYLPRLIGYFPPAGSKMQL
jgi:hypothetical protein